ncbi:hypothetical protein KKI24_03895 [bacterium]|nr:hypothetical protein [bacterium]
MVFFRSEEHLKNWAQYDPAAKDGISSLEGLLAMFSTSMFKRRLDTDYISNMKTYLGELISEIGNFKGLGVYMKS